MQKRLLPLWALLCALPLPLAPAFADDGAEILPPGYQVLDGNGDVYSGAKLYTYVTGTTTPKIAYSDAAETSAHTNPIVADSAGRFDAIYGSGTYKLVLKTSADVTIWTRDPIRGTGHADSVDYDNASSGLLADTVQEAIDEVNSKFFLSTRSISANTTLTSADSGKLVLASGTITVTMPLASTFSDGSIVTIKNIGNKLVTIVRQSSDTIDGQTSLDLYPQAKVQVASNNTTWYIAGGELAVNGLYPGTVKPSMSGTAEYRCVLAYGQTIGDTASGADLEGPQYELLFDIAKLSAPNAGTEDWAMGDTVALADLRGRAIFGEDDMGGVSANRLTSGSKAAIDGDTRGASGGTEEITLVEAEIPSHTHQTTAGGNAGALTGGSGGVGYNAGAQTASTGGDEAHNNMPPTIVLPYQICY